MDLLRVVGDARKKAEIIAGSAGVSITGIEEITYGTTSQPGTYAEVIKSMTSKYLKNPPLKKAKNMIWIRN